MSTKKKAKEKKKAKKRGERRASAAPAEIPVSDFASLLRYQKPAPAEIPDYKPFSLPPGTTEAEHFAPPAYFKAEIAALPQTGMTWFADFRACWGGCPANDSSMPSGRKAEWTYEVVFVPSVTDRDLYDAPPILVAMCGVEEDAEEGSLTDQIHVENLLKTIAKGCLTPAETSLFTIPSGRPRKVLTKSIAMARMLRPTLRKMGISEVGVAHHTLVEAMAQESTTVNTYGGDPETEGMLSDDEYVCEDRVSLGGWKPDPVVDKGRMACPLHWYARPPSARELALNGGDGTGYNTRMLWGWRTNVELACERGDVAKLKQIVTKQDRSEVIEHFERRLLLTKAARNGKHQVCVALVEHGAAVDGVQSSGNKAEWQAQQQDAGNRGPVAGMTPLFAATQAASARTVQFLLESGADPRLRKANGEEPIFNAVWHAEKDIVALLLQHGVSPNTQSHCQDSTVGMTPTQVAEIQIKRQPKGTKRYESILRALQLAKGDRKEQLKSQGSCANCSKLGCTLRCPCELVMYCDSKCQKADWKKHKVAHKKAVASNKSNRRAVAAGPPAPGPTAGWSAKSMAADDMVFLEEWVRRLETTPGVLAVLQFHPNYADHSARMFCENAIQAFQGMFGLADQPMMVDMTQQFMFRNLRPCAACDAAQSEARKLLVEYYRQASMRFVPGLATDSRKTAAKVDSNQRPKQTVATSQGANERFCAVCGSSDNLKQCSGCGCVYYCCKDHQRADWKLHKLRCKAMA